MISFCIATYNGEDYVIEQIKSIIENIKTNYEIIIVDDNSSDSTINVIKKLKNRNIKIIKNEKNLGVIKTFERAILNSSGDYIFLSDQDDVWRDDKIKLQLDLMKLNEKEFPNLPILVFSDLKVVNSNLEKIEESFIKSNRLFPQDVNNLYKLAALNSITGCTILVNKKSKETFLPISENSVMHDWWMALKILIKNGKILYINDTLVYYRQHDKNVLGSDEYSLYKKMCNLLNISAFIKTNYKHYKMIKSLGIDISYIKIFIEKIIYIFKRIKYK